MRRSDVITRIVTTDFENFVNDLTMALWNRMTESPQFHHLQPKDYPDVYETVLHSLKPYQISGRKGGSPS